MKPVGDRVLLRLIKQEANTEAGIEFASATADEIARGEVRAVGDGDAVSAKDFKSGDILLFSKYCGAEDVQINGEDYKIVNLSDILATEPHDDQGNIDG